MAPLQKRALWSLGVGILWVIITTSVFIKGGGIDEFRDNASFRLIMDTLYIAWLVIYAVLMSPVLRIGGRQKDKVIVDERDRAIMTWAPVVQLWSVIILLVAWTIGLSEGYHRLGQVPVSYMYVIFFSTLVISTIAQSLGILIGYWRMNKNA